jgi:hypothetical protein
MVGGGTVFELTANVAKTAWTHKIIYSFCAQGGHRCTDGSAPNASLIQDASGNLYGTTKFRGASGSEYDGGTVFELKP